MNIVFFSNPDFFGTQLRPRFSSMPRFTHMLAEGMTERGHKVSVWSPGSSFFRLPLKGSVKKWMGYIDQYLIFPSDVKKRLNECSDDTLFVFTDQAQGPWVPLVQKRRHVMHCHDFLSQWSAMNQLADHKTSWTGKRYQSYIRRGTAKGKNFIAGSDKTRQDLRKLLPGIEVSSEVVYNGLDPSYAPADVHQARTILGHKAGTDLREGYLLHVGGNQWYKNREGVIEIYNAWRTRFGQNLPLLLIGAEPSDKILKLKAASAYAKDIHLLSGLTDTYVRYAYSGATVFIFPSLAEGFGWPIAEAMASGCPVITTDEAPMTEVAGKAGFLIPCRLPDNADYWAADAAGVVQKIIDLSETERQNVISLSIKNAKRFDYKTALDQIENIYLNICRETPKSLPA